MISLYARRTINNLMPKIRKVKPYIESNNSLKYVIMI